MTRIGTDSRPFAPLALACAGLLLLVSACGPTPEQEAASRATAVTFAQATSTAIAQPTVAAQQTAQTVATETAAQATASAVATRTAVAQATAQARDVEARVQAAVAATQAAIPTATPVPPTATPVPPTQTPVVIVVTQVPQPAPAPVYVPVPVPVPSGSAPQFVIDAINESNNAYTRAKWTLNMSDLSGHIVGPELNDGQTEIRGLIRNSTRVASTLVSGSVSTWSYASRTRIIATTTELWRFVNYDATSYALKRDMGTRLYRNTYTIDLVAGGWKVSLDDLPDRNGEAI